MATNENRIHHAAIQYVAKHGYAPSVRVLSEHLGWLEDDCRIALTRLSEIRGVILKPDSFNIWAIHPFTLMPTPTWVSCGGQGWWANCAWCALGIGAALSRDIRISSRLGAHATAIEFELSEGVSTNSQVLIHFPFKPSEWWNNPYNPCGYILFFSSEQEIDSWCTQHNMPKGGVIDISTGVSLARRWFGDYMDPAWRRKTRQEARMLFLDLGLTSPFWTGD